MKKDKYTINNRTELNSCVALGINHMYNICNAKTKEEMNSSFMEAKDLLIAIYKYNGKKFETK